MLSTRAIHSRTPGRIPAVVHNNCFPHQQRPLRFWEMRSAVMAMGLLGLKVGMTQVYDDKGKMAPVTVLQVGPCPVLQVRDQERDGYDAVQLGFLDKARRKATRQERGHVSADLESKRRKKRADAGVAIPPKADVEPQRHIREYRLDKP